MSSVPKRLPSALYVSHIYNYRAHVLKSISKNSCSECNDLKDHVSTEQEPWRSTCHEFQCQSQRNILNVTEVEESIVDLTEDEESIVDLTEGDVQTISSPNAFYMDVLPQELLVCVFDFLDVYSLLRAVDVCTRWRDLVQSTRYQKEFEKFFDRLWPRSFRQLYPVMDHKVFLNFVNCRSCFFQERHITTTTGSSIRQWTPGVAEPRHFIRRITRELIQLPADGIHVLPVNDDRMDKLIAKIRGPKDSPFENGIFYISITYTAPSEYPFRGPTLRFLTKIFHPAISCHGHISVDLLGPGWSPCMRVGKILLSIQSMLMDTDFELCEHTPIGKLYKENRTEYERIARIWTQKFAMQHFIYPTCSPE